MMYPEVPEEAIKGPPPPYSEPSFFVLCPSPSIRVTPPPPYPNSKPTASSSSFPPTMTFSLSCGLRTLRYWFTTIYFAIVIIFFYGTFISGNPFGNSTEGAQKLLVTAAVMLVIAITLAWRPLCSCGTYLQGIALVTGQFFLGPSGRPSHVDLELGSVRSSPPSGPSNPVSSPPSGPSHPVPSLETGELPSRSPARLLRYCPTLRFPKLDYFDSGSSSAEPTLPRPPSPPDPTPARTIDTAEPAPGRRSGHARQRSKGGPKDE